MTVEQLIKKLKTFPQKAIVMTASIGVGGSVPITDVEIVDETWVDIIYPVRDEENVEIVDE